MNLGGDSNLKIPVGKIRGTQTAIKESKTSARHTTSPFICGGHPVGKQAALHCSGSSSLAGSFHLGLEGCAIICLAVGLGFGDTVDVSVLAGVGIKAGVALEVGADIGDTQQGATVSAGCKFVAGGGGYLSTTLTPDSSISGGGGIAIGGEAGCSVGLGHTWQF